MTVSFQEIDSKDVWDSFVLEQERYTFVQSWTYGQVLETLYDSVYRIGIFEGKDLVGLLPIGIVKAKRANYLRLRHGPVLKENFLNPEIFKQISEYLQRFAGKRKLDFIRIQPVFDGLFIKAEGWRSAPTHNLDAQHTLQLRLRKENHNPKSDEELLSGMRKQTRYYIRRSEKAGAVVRKDLDFENFYSLLLSTSRRQQYSAWPKTYFEALFELFGQSGLNLYLAEVGGKAVAMALFLDFGKYRFYLEGGMESEFANYFPSYLLQWESIKDAVFGGVEIYDFWGGIAPKDTDGRRLANYPWAGIDLFKSGFGGDEISISHPYDLPVKFRYWITWCYETIERKRRGY